ncbi:pantoate--beta-alanine ligase [Salinibacterium sp. UTAS2018]|uniref:pantoate--beta-alanine ligase n=1 Tax=unclassified Salinibacterium TaxID=2632331 RepID=UPI00100958AF|nr:MULTISPECIES: pantoate--beta-alanine ligase [unclassified Salinibacterium]MBH0008332.1 pantoate--beta-alanine ligase [Salinibacterium sp. SWN1162]QAV70355.1 pantoate--beta-alanine ligase [Salinibacterium sp. UTAS2018]
MSSHPRPQVIETVAGMRDVVAHERAAGRTIALTPTLGALHQGHLAHVERAAELADVRIVSIFVNPTQFGASEDLDKYPRTMDEDLDMLGAMGVPYVFAPSVEEMYPKGPTSTTISAGQIGTMFEGKTRPGHFDGVLTVVAKLLAITSPQFVTFGQKDGQQLFLVRRMITDLNIPVQLEIIETVREEDGLALSSRNQFLDDHQREAASILSTALNAATSAADSGLDAVIAAAQGALMGASGVELDYFTVVDTDTFMPVPDGYRGPAVALVAARVGETRLIDNATLYVG